MEEIEKIEEEMKKAEEDLEEVVNLEVEIEAEEDEVVKEMLILLNLTKNLINIGKKEDSKSMVRIL